LCVSRSNPTSALQRNVPLMILPFVASNPLSPPMSYSGLLILLAILMSSLIKICHLHNTSPLFLNHASTIFVTLDVFVILLIKLLSAPLLLLIHSKVDYFKSHSLNLSATQTNRFQLVLNSFSHTCKITQNWSTFLNSYLHSLLSFPSHRCTRSSSLITLNRPSLTPRLSDRCRTGNQCSVSRRVGVMCSFQRTPVTRRAAACNTDCNFRMTPSLTITRMALQ